MKKWIAAACIGCLSISLWAADIPANWGQWAAWGDQGDGTYVNPVIPADYSDIDCIRVGSEYYAISSTMQFSPGMVILQSNDLVNWKIAGHAVSDLTRIGPELNWDRMNRYGRGIWAGSIRYAGEKFWVLFGAPDEGYFITSAAKVEGPWAPLTCLLAEKGWDDCSALWDDDGQAYFIGTHFSDNYKTWLFKMAPDGSKIDHQSAVFIHEGNGREASKILKVDDWYYIIYSIDGGRLGRYVCAKRAKSMAGPWSNEKQLAHGGLEAHQPNQGGIISAPNGKWYFFTHHGAGDWEGRCASLLPVIWIDHWPIIGQAGQDGLGNMVWKDKKPVPQSVRIAPQTSDEFDQTNLLAQWEWNYQPRANMWSLTQRPGWLRLKAFKPLQNDDLMKAGNTLTQRSYRTVKNEVIIKLDISGMKDGQKAGLCHFSRTHSALGVKQQGTVRTLEYRLNGMFITGPEITGDFLWLRSTWGLDGKSQYAYSLDEITFTDFGDPYPLSWGHYRGDRFGIYNYNNKEDAGCVDIDYVHYHL